VAAGARPAGVAHRRGGGRWLVRGYDRRRKKRGARRRKNTTRVDEATITRCSNDTDVTFDVGIVERTPELITTSSERNNQALTHVSSLIACISDTTLRQYHGPTDQPKGRG